MSHVIHHTACPKCQSHGHDRSANNRAVYADGSSYCFRCGYYETATGLQRVKERVHAPSPRIVLPQDVSESLPAKCWEFLNKFTLTKQDASHNTILWSDKYDRVIFPYFNDKGLWGWQGRYLGKEKKAKWFSQGDLREHLHLLGNKRSRVVVLTEDIISAVKVSHCRQVSTSPLFGHTITTKRLLQLKKHFDRVLIWLDDDVKTKAAKFCYNAQSLGLDASVIMTKQDPKCLTDLEIEGIITCRL